jgi:hypothetical protein
MHYNLCKVNDAWFQQSRKVVLIFSFAKKEKHNYNHSCHLFYSDFLPYLYGEESKSLIIVKPNCSLHCVSSCGKNLEILHSHFLMKNLNPADQEKCNCKDSLEGSVIIFLPRWVGKSNDHQASSSALLCLLVHEIWDSSFLMRNFNPIDHLWCTHHNLLKTLSIRLSRPSRKMLICLWQ